MATTTINGTSVQVPTSGRVVTLTPSTNALISGQAATIYIAANWNGSVVFSSPFSYSHGTLSQPSVVDYFTSAGGTTHSIYAETFTPESGYEGVALVTMPYGSVGYWATTGYNFGTGQQIQSYFTSTSSQTLQFTVDTKLPTLLASSPADNFSSVGQSDNLLLTFSESVKAGSGNFVLRNLADDADTRTISVTDASQVQISGASVSVNPTADLRGGSHYALTFASGVIKDIAGNNFAGLSSDATLDFYTQSLISIATTNQVSTVNEGNAVGFTVLTANLADGTQLNYSLSGTGVTEADIVGGSLSGVTTIVNNQANIVVNLTADRTTEGPEALVATVQVQGQVQQKALSVLVQDTSKTAVEVELSTASVNENGAVSLNYVFSRSGDLSKPLTVNLAVTGTASDGDFSSSVILLHEPKITRISDLSTSSYDAIRTLTQGQDGSVFVGGITSGGFVAKYGTDGVLIWNKQIGPGSPDSVYAMTTALDGAFYVGGYTGGNLDGQNNVSGSDAFVSRYTSDGVNVWTRLLGTSGTANSGVSIFESTEALVAGVDGTLYVGGYTTASFLGDGQTNSGGQDAFLFKYAADGTKVWAKLLGTSGGDGALALTGAPDGAIYVTGYTTGNLDGQVNSGSSDAFLSKYLPDGSKSWTRLLGSGAYDEGRALTISSDGSIYVAGIVGDTLDGQAYLGGNKDVFLAKFQADGTKQWTRIIGSDGEDRVNGIVANADGSIVLGGTTDGNLDGQVSSGGIDALVAKFTADGSQVWTKLLGTSGTDSVNALIKGSDDAIFLAGVFDGLGGGSGDGFVSRLQLGSQLTFESGAASALLVLTPTNDALVESDETVLMNIAAGSGYDLGSASVATGTILDTTPTYALSAVAASVNEGGIAQFAITTTHVADGTSFNYDLSGFGISQADIVGGNLSGSVTVSGGTGTISVPLAADRMTEGAETLIANVQGLSASITVNDSSKATVAVQGLAYHWSSHAVMADTTLALESGVKSFSGAADSNGRWLMDTVDPGGYALSATRATADIGSAITSADALAALRLAVGLNPNSGSTVVSPYQFMAADVVGAADGSADGKVTAADALAILRMAVKLPSAPANQWMFVEDTRDFWDETTNTFIIDRSHASWDKSIAVNANADQNVNLVGILKGDVNGSWSAPANTSDLDIAQPSYFNQLHELHGVPLAQMGLI